MLSGWKICQNGSYWLLATDCRIANYVGFTPNSGKFDALTSGIARIMDTPWPTPDNRLWMLIGRSWMKSDIILPRLVSNNDSYTQLGTGRIAIRWKAQKPSHPLDISFYPVAGVYELATAPAIPMASIASALEISFVVDPPVMAPDAATNREPTIIAFSSGTSMIATMSLVPNAKKK